MAPFSARTSFSRRLTWRVNALEDVWVYWRCNGQDDVADVLDLGAGGLFIRTREPKPVGARVKIEFLVQEGQIRADAIVRHVEPNKGLGLMYTAMPSGDRPRLGMLITRLRHLLRLRTSGEVMNLRLPMTSVTVKPPTSASRGSSGN